MVSSYLAVGSSFRQQENQRATIQTPHAKPAMHFHVRRGKAYAVSENASLSQNRGSWNLMIESSTGVHSQGFYWRSPPLQKTQKLERELGSSASANVLIVVAMR